MKYLIIFLFTITTCIAQENKVYFSNSLSNNSYLRGYFDKDGMLQVEEIHRHDKKEIREIKLATKMAMRHNKKLRRELKRVKRFNKQSNARTSKWERKYGKYKLITI